MKGDRHAFAPRTAVAYCPTSRIFIGYARDVDPIGDDVATTSFALRAYARRALEYVLWRLMSTDARAIDPTECTTTGAHCRVQVSRP